MILLINIRFATCEARRLTRALACERRRISGRRLSPPEWSAGDATTRNTSGFRRLPGPWQPRRRQQ